MRRFTTPGGPHDRRHSRCRVQDSRRGDLPRTRPLQPVAAEPLFDRIAGLALVFDGRIDNRQELATDLDLRDDASVSDAAFVLTAYRRWGGDMLRRLLGDFALALWDGRERRL